MKINLLTLFPEYFETPLQSSILKRAQEKNLVEFKVINIRDFTQDKHHVTDDRPFGGGPGMVMKVDPIYYALQSLKVEKGQANSQIILTSAKGQTFNQPLATAYSQLETLTIICGHYEGVDERVAEHLIDAEVRIGDYVLTGGEPAAAVMTDAVTRLIPGVLGNDESNLNESHHQPGFLAPPTYTRPVEFNGWSVPEVLLTGHHAQIEDWKKDQSQKCYT